jgi:hypothetical protein
MRDRKTYLKLIRKRHQRLKFACLSVRTLAGVFVFIGDLNEVCLSLDALNDPWMDVDRRPVLSIGKISYVVNTDIILNEEREKINIADLNDDDLLKYHLYIEELVPVNEL